ncbi:MAG TPA: hypothetical protein VLF18_22720 [Tahibacter sp.]|uniref:hypothetical protein n=1 Tax=Tahibacter sp. TaxID=2056211 RepID=UPI002CDB1673|nr:hypothetical protein [Tahibacter sp.]HSX63010.1 hypothetical protein [Tahibacter sp.]
MGMSNMIGTGLRQWVGRAVLGVGASIAAAGSCAAGSNPIGLAFDPGFGTGGFAALPRHPGADAATTITPIGIVHLDASGGYVSATLQRANNIPRIVLTRYTESGQLDTGWGNGGSQMPALPSPYLDSGTVNAIRLVAGSESGQDIFYVAFSLPGTPGYSVAVAKFFASGAFDGNFGFGGYAVSALPVSAPNGLRELRGAAFTQVFGLPVLVVVVAAPNNRLVFSRAHGSGTAALSDQGGGSSIVFGNSPNVLQMRTNGPNHVELVGNSGDEAFYGDYDAGTLSLASRTFRFPCPGGTSASAIDALERPAGWNGDVLVMGRAACISLGTVAVVARMRDIATAPSAVWLARTETGGVCVPGGLNLCPQVMLAYSDSYPNVAITMTPQNKLVPVDTADGSLLAATPVNALGPDSYAQHSSYRGIVFRYPRLVGFGLQIPAVNGLAGLFVDGLFIDGFQ